MKESAIQSLLQLLALIANVEEGKISSKAHEIINKILSRTVKPERLDEYNTSFEEMVDLAQKIDVVNKSGADEWKRRASQSVKALVICKKSNEVLQQHEKIRILSRMIEFANEDGIISEKEAEFLDTVREAFYIDPEEYEDIKSFIVSPWIQGIRKDNLVLIDKNEQETEGSEKHLYWKNLEGQIVALYIDSCNLFIVKCLGTELLYRNALEMKPNSIEFLDNDSFIRGNKIAPIYYSTLNSRFFQDSIKKNLNYVARGVEYKFHNSNNGVQEFSLASEAGDLIGIMGGSGVGKSTLINVLNGSVEPQKGEILINGFNLHYFREKLEGIIGYIPQDDLLIDDLTVFQNLYYNAKLCFSNYSEIQILKLVIKVLKDLSLYEIRYLKVGNPLEKYISGGQRKRLNIGLELMREPLILFVDEPTSGLSSMDAEAVMLLLKKQTINGKIVLVNIHQPSSNIYKLFNKILVMDKGGYIVFQGDPLDAQVYFRTENNQLNPDDSQCETCGNVNPEQILEIVETKFVNEYGRFQDVRRFSPGDWSGKYKQNIESRLNFSVRKISLPQINFKVPSRWRQFLIFAMRDIRAKFENKQYMLITFLESPLLAFIIGYFTKFYTGTVDNPDGYIFSGNANLVSYLFMAVIVAMFLGMILSAEEIIKDALILKRESFLHLSRFAYINSKIMIVMGISAIQMLCFVIIGNYMLEIKGMDLKYWLILFSAASMANMIGLNISSALKTIASIYIVIPLILVPQILFSGTVVPFDKLRTLKKHTEFVPIIGDLMISRWTFEALAVEQFKNNRFQRNFFYQEEAMSRALFKTSFLFPRIRGVLDESEKLTLLDENSTKLEYNMSLARNEMNKLSEETGILLGKIKWDLTTEQLGSESNKNIQSYLDTLEFIFRTNYLSASSEKDHLIEKLQAESGGKNVLLDLQNDYHNQSISDLVLNRSQLQKIIEFDGSFIQRMDPIYDKPCSKIGRAHMYSSIKRLGPYEIDTYWFNLMVLWIFSFLAYIVLYFDLLKRTASVVYAFQIRRFDRLRLKLNARLR